MVIQILVTIGVILIVLPSIYSSYKKNNLTNIGTILWSLFWIIGLIVIWFPEIIEIIGHFFGVARSIDALVYISIILLIYLVLKQKIKINEIEKEITILTRKISLQKVKK